MDGLTLIPDFITDDEEEMLICNINKQPWNTSLKRLTQHYGYTYNYSSKSIDRVKDKAPNIPDWISVFTDRMLNDRYISVKPDQVIINRYLPGEGISAHIDAPYLFKDRIYSISLGSSCKMIFRKENDTLSPYIYQLMPRTLLIMEDDARYKYTHEIPSVKNDMFLVNPLLTRKKRVKRTTRYSITFRNVLI